MKLLKILLGFALTMIATGLALQYVPDLLPKVASTLHVSVDTIRHYVQFAIGGTGLSTAVCTLTGWTESCDDEGNIAGIDKFWVAKEADINNITFNVSGEVTEITMVGAAVFEQWEFPEDVGFVNQPITVNRGSLFVKQVLNFTNYKQRTLLRNAIANLLNCGLCGLVFIVRDNNGRYWVLGVKKTTGGYILHGLKPVSSDGGKTGTNSESDSNEYTIQFEGKVGELARELVGGEAAIPTEPGS